MIARCRKSTPSFRSSCAYLIYIGWLFHHGSIRLPPAFCLPHCFCVGQFDSFGCFLGSVCEGWSPASQLCCHMNISWREFEIQSIPNLNKPTPESRAVSNCLICYRLRGQRQTSTLGGSKGWDLHPTYQEWSPWTYFSSFSCPPCSSSGFAGKQ